jgi:hypothetical protein
LPSLDEARGERGDAKRGGIFARKEVKHRCIPGDGATGNAVRCSAGAFAGAREQRCDGLADNRVLHPLERARAGADRVDAGHHVVAETDLLVESAGAGEDLARGEVGQKDRNGSGPDIEGEGGVPRPGREERLVRARNIDPKRLADERTVLDAGTVGNADREVALGPDLARADGRGRAGFFTAEGDDGAGVQLDFAATAKAALAATRIQRETVIRQRTSQ